MGLVMCFMLVMMMMMMMKDSAVSWRGEWSWSRLITPFKRDTVRDKLKSGVTVALCAYVRTRHNNKLQNENWKRVHAKCWVIIILHFLLTYCALKRLLFPVKLNQCGRTVQKQVQTLQCSCADRCVAVKQWAGGRHLDAESDWSRDQWR